ncbi:MAG: type 1 glutamine amidotransferase [Parachlamydia sp.]|jgi:protease I|nr:type 1 glutamine amidotransferase [Parachlamydia sp.]
MNEKKKSNQKALILVENLYDEMEVFYPLYRLAEEGIVVAIVGPKAEEIYTSKHGMPCTAQISITDVKEHEYDALIIPGGYAPDKLRRDPKVLELVQKFHQKEKPIAFICHAGWVPISAKILKGVKCTSAEAIKDDLINAGAEWVNEPVVRDRHIISSRKPADLPEFCRVLIQALHPKRPERTVLV